MAEKHMFLIFVLQRQRNRETAFQNLT